jgi:LPXTG-motif cell wall-anchored protein
MILSSDNVLIINIPVGYEVESVSPDFDERDGNGLIWDGTLARSFDKGEPALVLSREKTDTGIWVLVLALVILAAAASVIFFKRKKSSISSTNDNADPIPSPTATEVLEDEEMIEQILIGSGGQMYQSEIVKLTGFSKSKISIVLSKMKEDGIIIKIKKGKGNIIRLVNE